MLRAEKEVTGAAWKGALDKVRGVLGPVTSWKLVLSIRHHRERGQEGGGVKRSFGNLAIRKLLVPSEISDPGKWG